MRTWTWIVAMVLVAACKDGKDKAAQQAVKAALAVPKVGVATVLAKEDGKPPFLIIIEDAGVRVAAAPSWADLDAGKLKITKRSGPLDEIDRYVREGFAFGREPRETVLALDESFESGGARVDLSALEDTTTRDTLAQDDPPPPEEEDKPDDGEDESGGTGTAIALEEGKMGKKDSDRAEGQYKMRKNQEDPQLARQQAIEQARAAGILGSRSTAGGPAGLGVRPNDGAPSRLAQVQGTVIEDGKLEPLRTLILIAPSAKATKLIDAIRATDGAIAVSHAGKIRPLRLQFMTRDYGAPSQYWLETRVSTKGLVIEAVPDTPIEVADLKELAAALDKARTKRGADADAPVDILVDGDVDVQRMIDVVVALDTAGVRAIGMGSMPSGDELAVRGHRTPTISLGQPNVQGDLDKAIIRRVVRAAAQKIFECYKPALAKNPDLAGTVQTQFFIAPNGSVATVSASGLDPDVATCVAGVIERLEFPKPKGGGGVQVNYPFSMRP